VLFVLTHGYVPTLTVRTDGEQKPRYPGKFTCINHDEVLS
jgi:hypothetical protein